MIYTAISDNYDEPRTDIKCFTTYDRFKEPRRNAKIYKVLPHLFMPDEKWWVWIDGNLTLKVPEKKLIELAGDSEVAVFENPYRETTIEEAKECKRLKLDTDENINWQIEREDNKKLAACFLIIRKNTPQVRMANNAWWAEICAGSVRDQISFPQIFESITKYLPKVHPFHNEYFSRHGHTRKRIIYGASQQD